MELGKRKMVLGVFVLFCSVMFGARRYSLRPEERGARGRVTLQPFLADSLKNTGIAVVVCPGGSYSWHDMKNEGVAVARWLQENGINAYVLRYRVATVAAYVTGFRALGVGNKYPDMLEDVEDALAYVYSHQVEDGVDTSMIGVMGFSAGGHLAVSSFVYNRGRWKPKFVGAIYPVVTMSDGRYVHKRSRRGALGVWGQYDKVMRDSLSLERHITGGCPPVFLVNCVDDDVVRYENSVVLDSALTREGVPHVYLQYKVGGHGFGASDVKGSEECRRWKDEFLKWIMKVKDESLVEDI